MKFVPVKEIPNRWQCGGNREGRWHRLQDVLEEFIRSDVRIVRIDYEYGEYKNARSCMFSFIKALTRCPGGDTVRVVRRGDTVYLKKV